MDLPVIDLSAYGLLVEDENSVLDEDITRLANEVCGALSDIGFMYVKGHGIPQHLIDELMGVYRNFFAQPTDLKSQFQRGVVSSGNFGWIQAEQEALNPERPKDLKEAFNFTYEPLQKWPETHRMKDASIEFFETCTRLAMRILDLMAIGLDIKDRKFFTRCHKKVGLEGNFSTVRCLHYPPVSTNNPMYSYAQVSAQAHIRSPTESTISDEAVNREGESIKSIKPGQIRCGEHSDYGSITLLFQDNAGGLEVLCPKAGKYLAATPMSDCVLVNIGDLMQLWTGGKLRATKHKVIIPQEDIDRQRTRQSIAFFVHPDDEVMVKSIMSNGDEEAVNAKEWTLEQFKVTYK